MNKKIVDFGVISFKQGVLFELIYQRKILRCQLCVEVKVHLTVLHLYSYVVIGIKIKLWINFLFPPMKH